MFQKNRCVNCRIGQPIINSLLIECILDKCIWYKPLLGVDTDCKQCRGYHSSVNAVAMIFTNIDIELCHSLVSRV